MQQLTDGSWECGKAKFCNSLVALEPLFELRLVGSAEDRSVRKKLQVRKHLKS